jgi:crossover junction endodeoxyribonuclease RuvC
MRVLGIDPGLTRCGLGVVDGLPGRRPHLIAVDVIRTSADLDVARRLVAIEQAVEEWVTNYRPTAVAIERVFAQHNVQTVMGTAQAAGVAMLVAARRGIAVSLHTPSEVKAAITGSGRAPKDQVAAMVRRILDLESAPRPADATDALALAICHVWRGGTTARLDAAVEAATAHAARQRAAFRAVGRPSGSDEAPPYLPRSVPSWVASPDRTRDEDAGGAIEVAAAGASALAAAADEGALEGADATIVAYGAGAASRGRSRRTEARSGAPLASPAIEVSSIREARDR